MILSTSDFRCSNVENRRFSITRLKPLFKPCTGENCVSRKQKILDYEIETQIPSLRPYEQVSGRKQKILDYEIETCAGTGMIVIPSALCRKQKILDFEIETIHVVVLCCIGK